MLAPSIASKALKDARWQVLGYGTALFALAVFTAATWPAFRDEIALIEIPEAIKAFIGADKLNIATAAGFLNARFYSWTIVLPLVLAVTQGTGAIAGEESAGTLDLLLAQPLRRADLVVTRSLAFCASAALIIALGAAGFAVTLPFIDIEVSFWDTLVACANMIFVTLMFYGVSLWLGAVAPTRGHAIGVAIGLLTVFYFADVVAAGIDALNWVHYTSPFYYYGRGLPLVEGINWWHAGLLTGIGLLFVGLAIRTFERRDVTLGGASEMTLGQLLQRIAG